MTQLAVDLLDLKAHLRVDSDDEDDQIVAYGLTATGYAEHLLGREIIKVNDDQAVCESLEEVPQEIKTWIKLYVETLYSKRGVADAGQSAFFMYDHLLDGFILYGRKR